MIVLWIIIFGLVLGMALSRLVRWCYKLNRRDDRARYTRGMGEYDDDRDEVEIQKRNR